MRERDDIVALDSSIILHPKVWEASGHVGGFTDPLVDCRTCKQRFRADHSRTRARGGPLRQAPVEAARRDARLRPDRGAPVQPDVPDAGRRGGGDGRRRLPAAGDGAGDLHQLQERRPDRAAQAAVRDRAGRQVVPQRDHAGQLHLPHARVRADGDGVLRAARRGGRVVPLLGRRAARAGTCATASARATCACAPHEADELSHYSSATSDIEYLFPIGWSELEGIANRGDFDLTQHTRRPGRSSSGSSAGRRALHAARDRAGARRQPLDARLPDRRLRRGGRRRARADRAAPAPAARAGEGGRAAADRQGRRHGREGARASTRSCAATSASSTTTTARSAAATGARTRSGRRTALTIDEQTLEDDTVTIRDRDSLAQERIPIGGARAKVAELLAPTGGARRQAGAPRARDAARGGAGFS